MNTREYVSILEGMVNDGYDAHMKIVGSSMSPFLCHNRDIIFFRKPTHLERGDVAFFKRDNGAYVVHRIYKIKGNDYYFVGDNQTDIEGPIRRDQIFGYVYKIIRKNKEIKPGDFWWFFFKYIWIRIIPIRFMIVKLYKGSAKWNH